MIDYYDIALVAKRPGEAVNCYLKHHVLNLPPKLDIATSAFFKRWAVCAMLSIMKFDQEKLTTSKTNKYLYRALSNIEVIMNTQNYTFALLNILNLI